MKNETNQSKNPDPLATSIRVTSLGAFTNSEDVLGLITIAAALEPPERKALVDSAVNVILDGTPTELAIKGIEAKATREAKLAELGLQEQMVAATQPWHAASATVALLPQGFELFQFGCCLFVLLGVTAADVWNSLFLVVQQTQSYTSALAFLGPSAAAPFAAKLAINKLPPRLRATLEQVLCITTPLCGAAFLALMVMCYAAPQSLDQLASGLGTDRRWVTLVALLLGFQTCVLVLGKAFSLVRRSVLAGGEANPVFAREAEKLVAMKRDAALETVAMEAQKPRLDEIQRCKLFLFNYVMAGAEQLSAQGVAEREAVQALANDRLAASRKKWQVFSNALRKGVQPAGFNESAN